jgi:hypothetical protein
LDVRERLGHLGGGKLFLAQFVHRLVPGSNTREVAVAPGHVVVRVKDDLAGQLVHGHVVHQFKRNRDH